MADIQANIGINLDTSRALAQLKNLQRQISVFNAEIARGGGKAATAAAGMQQELVNSINATGQFSASMTSVRSTTESFTNALEKNKLSLGETFRYAGASTKKFSHLFSGEFNTIEKVARERVKTIQTQFIKMGRDANGAIKAIAVRPLALDMNNLATQTAMAAQKQQILNQLLRQGSTNLLNWGKNTQWAGRQLMVGFTIPLALFGAAASKSFMELEEQAIKFKRVYGDLFTTPQQADQAFADMKKLGEEFTKYGVSVEKTIGLAASVAQMGMTGAALTAQVTEATRLAVLGGMEQEDALNTTISLTNAFGIAAEDLTDKINFLNAAENQTILSIQDFNEAVPRAGSVVAQLGGGVEDLAFFLTAMREGGIEASQGANALKTSLGRLVNPTAAARQELMAYGIDVVGIVERNAGNLRQTVMDLGTALDQLDPLDKARAVERLFGKFQFARMSALFNNIMDEGSQAATVLDLINSSASDLATIAGRELGRVEESAATKFRSSVEKFQASLAPIGEAFLKLVTPIVEFGTRVLNAFNNLGDGTKTFVIGLIAVLGGIGPILIMTVGLLANGVANLLKIFLGLQTAFQKIRSGTKGVADQTEYMTQQQLEAAAAAASLNQSHSTLQQTFTSELAAVNNLVAAYQKMTTAQRNALGVPQVVSSTARVPGFAKGRKVPGYKDGVVMVPGPKGAGDIQPAMLAPGEAVIPAAMAEKYGPLINAMIAGNIPGYMAGVTTSKRSGLTSTPKQPGTAVSSHVSGLTPGQLAASIKELADAGYEIAGTVRRISESSDKAGVVIDLFSGNIADLISETDIITTGGARFAGTAMTETASRNAMYNDVGIPGDWMTLDDAVSQEKLLNELDKTSSVYQRHQVEIESLLAEIREAKLAISQSSDQERAKLELNKQRVKQVIQHSLMGESAMTQEQAEIEASKQVEQADEIYAQKIRDGFSAEESLKEARLFLTKKMIESGNLIFSAAEAAMPSAGEWVKADTRGSGSPSRSAQRTAAEAEGRPRATVVKNFDESDMPTGTLNPPKGRTAVDTVATLTPAQIKALQDSGRTAISKMKSVVLKALQKELQSSSPSKVIQREMKNVVDGAVKAVREGQDDMQQAGSQLAEAAETGVRSRRRGDPSRTRTAGEFTTPGQPAQLSILRGDVIERTNQQLNVSSRSLGTLAASAVNGANKLGAVGIGLSSLVGAFSMVEGPVGDFVGKLFPAISAVTGLTFALNFLKAEEVKAAVDTRISTAKTSVARQIAIKNIQLESIARNTNTRITEINTAAKNKNSAATNAATGATGRLAFAMNGAAASVGIGAVKIGASFGKFGAVAGSVVRGIGGALGSLTGLSPRIALVVAGLALLAGGVYLVVKMANEQAAKIKGLGDAANISADKLGVLNTVLGTQLAIDAQMGSGVSGLSTGTIEEDASAAGTQKTLQESDEFKKEFKGITGAIKGASQEAAEQALTSLALTLQTAGAEKEMIAGVVNAILAEAGRTDIVLDFENISIANAPEVAKKSVEEFARTVESERAAGFMVPVAEAGAPGSLNNQEFDATLFGGKGGFVDGRGGSTNIATAIGPEALASLEAAGATLASTMQNATIAFDTGQISAEEYDAQMQSVSDTISGLVDRGDLVQARMLVNALANELKEIPGMEDIGEKISGLVGFGAGTSTGVSAAEAVIQAESAGVSLSLGQGKTPEEESANAAANLKILEAGSKVGASPEEIKAAADLTNKLNELTNARIKNDEIARAGVTSKANVDAIDEESTALEFQANSIRELNGFLEDSTGVTNKAAVAQKIANDETALAAWQIAQEADALEGGTAARDAYIESIQNEATATAEVDYEKSMLDLKAQVQAKEESAFQTDALTIALGDAALAEAAMGNAAVAAAISFLYADAILEDATITAAEFAEKMGPIIAQITALAGAGVISVPTGGGGGGTPKSFLDDIVKGLRDVASGQTKVTEGFKSSLRALVAFSKAGVKGLNGLSSQLRKAGVTGTFAEQILGMDPKDWERQKKQLFNFNAAGEITGLTAAGEAVKEALGVVEIGKFIDEQQNLTVSVGHQIEALNRLTGAGASYEAAYDAVQNAAFASAVATAKSTELITAAAQEAMAAMAKMKELEEINEEEERKKRISEAIREQNKEFSNQAKILDHINKSNYSEAQINEILNNKDLQSLVLEPSIDPGALSTALANAEKQAGLELRIKKLTVEGQEDIFQEGVSNAMSAFGALEEEIDIEFRATIKDDDSLVRDAERQIALIDFELDDYQAGLDEIDRLEQDINDVYDKRIEALDEVATLNEDIARSQESQLEIADALSKGDIAAAARAAQQSRQVQQESAREAQQRMLEEQRASEISRLRSSSGMTREELQDRVRDLEEQIFNIEEKTLEPAQERIRLAEITRDDRVADLQVLGKTREEWDKISNSVDVAQANGWRFADAMQEALNIVEKLVNSLTNRPAPPSPPASAATAPASARSSDERGSSSAPAPPPAPAPDRTSKIEREPLPSLIPLSGTVSSAIAASNAAINAKRSATSGTVSSAISSSKAPAYFDPYAAYNKMAMGGLAFRSRSGPPQQYFGGGKVKGPGTEKSDSIPALLSNGEYVIRASSVRLLGKDFLDKLNGGKVVPRDKDGLPAFKGGGIAKAAPKKYTPPVSIRQIERAASKPASAPAPSPRPTPKPSLPPSRTVATPAPAPEKPGALFAMKGTPAPQQSTAIKNEQSQNAPRPSMMSVIQQSQNAPPPPKFLDSFKMFDGTAVGAEKAFQNMAGAIGSNETVQKIGNWLSGETVGATALRGVLAAFSVPVEAMGNIALQGLTLSNPNATNSDKARAAFNLVGGLGIPSAVANAFSGVLDPSKQKDMMFTQAGNYVADNRLFGATDAEGQARARLVGGALNLLGDPLLYAGGAGIIRAGAVAGSRVATSGARVIDNAVPSFPIGANVALPSSTSGLRSANLDSMLKNIDDANIGPDEIRLLDQISASTFIDEAGLPLSSPNTNAMSDIAKALDGDLQAQELLNQKVLALQNIIKENVSRDIGEVLGEVADPSKVTAIHSTSYPIQRNPSGEIILQPSGAYNPDIPRSTIHFTLEDTVKSHMFGEWGPEQQKIVSQLSSMIENNGLPSNINPIDTWWNRSPGQNLTLPSSSHVISPYTNLTEYSDELIRRGLLEPGKMPPVLAVDNATNEILHILKDAYSPVEIFQMSKLSGRTPRIGQESEHLADLALKIAKERMGTDTKVRSLEQHGTTDFAFDQSVRNLAASLGIRSGIHQGSGSNYLEMLGLKSESLSGIGIVDSIDALRYAALRGMFGAPSIPDSVSAMTPPAFPRKTQSSEFIQGSSLTRLKKPPKDVEYHPGTQMMVSDFAEDVLGNKFFVKGHLRDEGYGYEDTIRSSFDNEFLAGRIGNYIGANTPQSYVIKRSAGDVAVGSNMRSGLARPFEIATDVIPSSHSLDPEYMRRLVLNSDNPYKTIEELFDGFVDYSETTPALNAIMGNSDLHYNNVLWSNATKKFNQIDFNEAKPNSLKMAPGIPGTSPRVRDAQVIAKSSMAIVREALNDSVSAAIENQLLSQSQQLALIGRMNASGFKLTANKNATDPLYDTVLDITTTQDYTKLFEKIANSDAENYIPQALRAAGSDSVIDPFLLKTIQERAEVLSEFGRVSLNIGDYGMMAQRMGVRGKGFMAGGFVKSRNTDNIPAMLSAGEYVVKRSAVQSFGADNLEKINNGTYNDGSVYNYNLAVNVKSDADPNKIARTVITNIRGIENQRVRGNKL